MIPGEIQELGMEEILERIDGRPLGGEIIVGQIQQVEGDRFCQNV